MPRPVRSILFVLMAALAVRLATPILAQS